MSFDLPPIVRLAERLLVDVEQAVMRFHRSHKYLYGSDLRRAAMDVATRAQRAWRDRAKQPKRITQLLRAIDTMKICLQLGSRIRAFRSFGQFEALARIAHDLGRQAGGWHRQQHPKSQNPPASPPQERAQKLSPHAASSIGAHP